MGCKGLDILRLYMGLGVVILQECIMKLGVVIFRDYVVGLGGPNIRGYIMRLKVSDVLRLR